MTRRAQDCDDLAKLTDLSDELIRDKLQTRFSNDAIYVRWLAEAPAALSFHPS